MNTAITIVNILFYSQNVLGRDFYLGIFRRDDFLIAQDNIFKQKRPYSYVRADYGRLFKCPISYFRVVDRLGMAGGPSVKIMRGGLNKKYIAIRINSHYNLPISVNIYVGCHNQRPRLPLRPNRTATKMTTVGYEGNKDNKGKNSKTTTISDANSQTQTDAVTETKGVTDLDSQTTIGADEKPGKDAATETKGDTDLESQTTTGVDGKPGTDAGGAVASNDGGSDSGDTTTTKA